MPATGGFPQPASSRLFRNIAVTFVLITVAVIGIALWTSSVRATITVKAKPLPVNLDTVVEIASVPATGQIKGRVVSGAFVESKEFAVEVTTSVAAVPPAQPVKTTGKVRITNKNSKDQPLVATTRLLTADGKLYRLVKGVTVPAGGSLEAQAASDQPGAQYEIPAGTKMTIPGLFEQMQKLVFAEATSAFAMGEQAQQTGPRKILTADALANAQQELYATVLDRAKQSLTVEAGAPAGWESVFVVTNSGKQSNAAVGQETEKFLAQVKVNVTAVFFPKEDVAAYIRSRLNEKLSEGYALSDPGDGSGGLDVNFRMESADPAKGVAKLTISAEGQSRLSKDSPELKKDLIVGLPSDEVIRKWSALDGVDEVDVVLQPSWVHRLPSMKDKIDLIIQ